MTLRINSTKLFSLLPSPLINRYTVNLGYIPDDYNEADYLFSASPMNSQSISGEVSLVKYFKEISDQSYLGSCVSNAIADTFEAQKARRDNISPLFVKNLSRLFIYWNARNLATPPITDRDRGCQIRFGFDSIRRYGVPTEDIYPYITSKVNDRPGWLAYKSAIQNKITNFYRISQTGDDRILQIKRALSAGCPVVFGTDVYESFRHVTGQMIVDIPTDKYLGGHSMILIGWSDSKNAFRCRNSWGTSWGDQGYCYISPRYIKHPMTRDLWAATI